MVGGDWQVVQQGHIFGSVESECTDRGIFQPEDVCVRPGRHKGS